MEEDYQRPKLNNGKCVKEKIILLVDTSHEMSLPFPPGESHERASSCLEYIKKSLEIFLLSKDLLNQNHEYALLAIQDDVVICYQEFTHNSQLLLDIIYDLEPMETPNPKKEFLLDPVLEQINTLCQLPVTRGDEMPPYVVRTIMMFGRSHCELTASESLQEIYESLQLSPYFFFDTLFMFDENDEENIVQGNCDFINEMDSEQKYYSFQVGSRVTAIFESFAKLLAHPLQRCRQSDSNYKLKRSAAKTILPHEATTC